MPGAGGTQQQQHMGARARARLRPGERAEVRAPGADVKAPGPGLLQHVRGRAGRAVRARARAGRALRAGAPPA